MSNPAKFGVADGAQPHVDTLIVNDEVILFRSLSEHELDEIVALLAPRLGGILDRFARYLDEVHIPAANLPSAAQELAEALVVIVPHVIAFGTMEPDAHGHIGRLPAGLSFSLFALIVEPTIRLFGWGRIISKLAVSAEQQSNLGKFLEPIARERVMKACLARGINLFPAMATPQRVARRRTNHRRH
ncbi:MAG: hypothetical protein JO056_00850 [Alphaproteobacteria bacterium]|nr:hypothetical protein [Alphaproteobacteria bacterium]